MSNTQTLRASLISGNCNHSLSNRFRLATQLATAVCSVYTFGLVHKSIQPENIVIFQDQDSALGSAFLIGFDKVRPEEGRTRLTSDIAWEKNLYRHPQRQGVKLQDAFVMQHDIYSLGVCLLEIGLWTSFVQYPSLTSGPIQSQDYKFDADMPDTASYPEFVKEQLLSLVKDLLRRHMGSKYANIVQTCLTCLDKGNEEFGDESEFQDKDGVLIAVRYIEKVSCHLSFRGKVADVLRFCCSSVTSLYE
jgi:serine/threonine protein kinase